MESFITHTVHHLHHYNQTQQTSHGKLCGKDHMAAAVQQPPPTTNTYSRHLSRHLEQTVHRLICRTRSLIKRQRVDSRKPHQTSPTRQWAQQRRKRKHQAARQSRRAIQKRQQSTWHIGPQASREDNQTNTLNIPVSQNSKVYKLCTPDYLSHAQASHAASPKSAASQSTVMVDVPTDNTLAGPDPDAAKKPQERPKSPNHQVPNPKPICSSRKC